MFRRNAGKLEVLLVHPGGPYFRKKDDGAWTIPKGEVVDDEDLLARARTEFEEELGIPAPPTATWIELGSVKQKGGKTVHAWAFEGDLPDGFTIASNTFEIEWPPGSGTITAFPEVDQASFFSRDEARKKMNPAQNPFLHRLANALGFALSPEQ
jgi:predicted NUDIX family NTP pyrophosphohydrolase